MSSLRRHLEAPSSKHSTDTPSTMAPSSASSNVFTIAELVGHIVSYCKLDDMDVIYYDIIRYAS